MIDRLLAEKYFEGQDPLGRRLGRGGPDGPRWTVVGVVEPVKIRDLERPETKETIYWTYRQVPIQRLTFVIRAEVEPSALVQPLRDTISSLDPELPVYGIVTLEQQLKDSFQTRRVSMLLLVAFAALAVVLAAVGIYGVLAFSISQRLREIGTRMALGARPPQILKMVMGQGLTLTLIGVGIGIALALGLGRLLASMLFGVTAYDPATFAGVSALLVAVSTLACFRPARRATRVDPIEALREE